MASGYVYIAQQDVGHPTAHGYDDYGGPFKVGYALNPEHRVQTWATGSPYPVRLIGYFQAPPETERQLHAILAEYRLNGEWFKPDVEVQSWAMTFRCPDASDEVKVACVRDHYAALERPAPTDRNEYMRVYMQGRRAKTPAERQKAYRQRMAGKVT